MCKGSGFIGSQSATVSGIILNMKYVWMMSGLPGLEIATKGKKNEPFLFRFEGGIGAVMPMTRWHLEHVRIKT
ncbi:MAG: hypothetical protein H0X01_02700 [Nitrospira sp.]|nr:hypothetical protein [Nitrospira sp.]